MNAGTIILIVVAIIVVLLLVWVISTYNSLVHLRNKVKDQWAQISVLLKRRSDLIPNLVETIKGYTKHESETLEKVISARNKGITAVTQEDTMKASGELSQAISKLLMLTESYPDLKANTNFMDLQANLKDTEDKLQYARQFYNDAVLSYKNKLEMFPSNIIAGLFHFQHESFFEVDEASKEVPKVQF